MAKNEDGEFELILGNNQLLSVFFLMVLLLALCFVGGYVVGRNAAPVISAGNAPPVEPPSSSTSTTPAKVEVAKAEPAPAPVKTAPQAPPETKAPETKAPETKAPETKAPPPPIKEVAKAPLPPLKEVAKSAPKEAPKAKAEPPKTVATKAPPPPAPATKSGPISSAAIAGRRYLQLSATSKDKAEVMADLVRRANLPAIAAPIPDRPDIYRVLVGPVTDDAVDSTRAKLTSAGFPGKDAISKVF